MGCFGARLALRACALRPFLSFLSGWFVTALPFCGSLMNLHSTMFAEDKMIMRFRPEVPSSARAPVERIACGSFVNQKK